MTRSSLLFVVPLVGLALGCSGSSPDRVLDGTSSSSGSAEGTPPLGEGGGMSSGGTPQLPPTSGPGVAGREPPEPASLFEPPTGDATPDVLFGAWAELDDGLAEPAGFVSPERRMFLGKGAVLLAVRCRPSGTSGPSGLASVRVAARVDATTKVTILESKADTKSVAGPEGPVRCATQLAPVDIASCDGQPGKMPSGGACFRLAGTSLVIHGNTGLAGQWMKLED